MAVNSCSDPSLTTHSNWRSRKSISKCSNCMSNYSEWGYFL